MKKRVCRSLAFTLLALACSAHLHEACAVTLVYTNDVLGEIEPCGCRSNPQGGMLRKAGFLKRLDDKSILQLDGGDLLFSTNTLPAGLAKQAEIQAGYLLRSMDLTRHDAVVPGEKDFALGVTIFEKLIKKSKIHFLAANLRRYKGNTPFLEESQIFDRKRPDGSKIRIAVIGLVGSKLTWPEGLRASDPIEVAKLEVPKLRKNADVVIALTHEGLEEDQALAKAVPGIDYIVGGHTQSFLQTPLKEGNAWIFQSSFRNQYVGMVPIDGPFKVENHRLIGLDASYDDPAGQISPMAALVAEFKKAVGEANLAEEAKLTRSAPEPGDTPVAKFQTFPKCAECHWKQFDFWRKTPHGNALQALVDKHQAQNKECLGCHTVGLGDKQGFSAIKALAEINTSDGAKKTELLAFDDLASFLKAMHEVKSLKEPVKLRRADTGGIPLRTAVSKLERSWAPVQCENCHQPGRDHPFSASYTREVAKNQCLSCHTPNQAPEWYTKSKQPDWSKIEAKRALIKCPAGELGDDEN